MSTKYVDKAGAQCAMDAAWWIIRDGVHYNGPAQVHARREHVFRDGARQGPQGPIVGSGIGELSYADLQSENLYLRSVCDLQANQNRKAFNECRTIRLLLDDEKERMYKALDVERQAFTHAMTDAEATRVRMAKEILHLRRVAGVSAALVLVLTVLLGLSP